MRLGIVSVVCMALMCGLTAAAWLATAWALVELVLFLGQTVLGNDKEEDPW